MLKEKIGQMLMIGFKGERLEPQDAIVQAILSRQIGGVILFDYDFKTKKFEHNIVNPSQLKRLTQQLQHYAKQAEQHSLYPTGPLLVGVDYEGGLVNRLKENYGFPVTLTAADMGKQDDQTAEFYANRMANTLKEVGINLNFAPVVDVNINPESPVIGKLGRSFSNMAEKVVNFASIFAKAYRDHGVLCAYKHFPGHGSANGDTHAGFVDITQTWQANELLPYQDRLADIPIVLTAHVVHRGLDPLAYPASLSNAITTGLLREQLKFNGVVVTDDMQMKAVTDHYSLPEAVRLAVNAGADILVFGNQLSAIPQHPIEIIEMIYADVLSGNIAESRIEEAYRRIINLKNKIKFTDSSRK